MQSSEGGSDTTASVTALRTSSSAQAPVVQPVPASQQVGFSLGLTFLLILKLNKVNVSVRHFIEVFKMVKKIKTPGCEHTA